MLKVKSRKNHIAFVVCLAFVLAILGIILDKGMETEYLVGLIIFAILGIVNFVLAFFKKDHE
ncbi:hypothetical protein [Parasporobacterium paucivorans]|uniref:Uncharacterized protein n=1 Tax=Parasporobacterium paucivorans DSM 15970 TaxID=1122934 RepID=A0A1M6EMZ9_9FIRM|nr:hypothetical protein [Parasporobacterium paucivorans]SHI86915.1 hypothetical protein SAMN02745691_00956 [Parasporobacterium paucivorans DSM 15970]